MQNQSIPKCFNHPESDATSVCHYCQRQLCIECLVESNNHKHCKDDFDCLDYQSKEGKYKPISEETKEEKHRQEPEEITNDTFSHLVESIKRYADLKENWDGASALPITGSAITRAIRLLHIFRRRGFLKQNQIVEYIYSEGFHYDNLSIEPTDIGGILFEWGQPWGTISVEVPPEENLSLSYVNGYSDGEKYIQNNEYIDNYNKLADKLEDEMVSF